MEQSTDIYSLSDREIAKEIGAKARMIRLNSNITADELQRMTGIHRKTIGDMEGGKNVTLATMIGILRGLNALDLLGSLVEDEEASPVAMAMNSGKVRERATGRR